LWWDENVEEDEGLFDEQARGRGSAKGKRRERREGTHLLDARANPVDRVEPAPRHFGLAFAELVADHCGAERVGLGVCWISVVGNHNNGEPAKGKERVSRTL
jgi:hypothetical protein